jgi:hypothetical protein
MSKKILFFILCCSFSLQAAQHQVKKPINNLVQLEQAIQQMKTKTHVIKRPEVPYVSNHRTVTFDGNSDQCSMPQQKK